jgi:mono/diheme cytochrome c family protein
VAQIAMSDLHSNPLAPSDTRMKAGEAIVVDTAMPSLGFRLNDEKIAAVVTYVRNSWGNAASPVCRDRQGAACARDWRR